MSITIMKMWLQVGRVTDETGSHLDYSCQPERVFKSDTPVVVINEEDYRQHNREVAALREALNLTTEALKNAITPTFDMVVQKQNALQAAKAAINGGREKTTGPASPASSGPE